jgi:hypothetical protein
MDVLINRTRWDGLRGSVRDAKSEYQASSPDQFWKQVDNDTTMRSLRTDVSSIRT